MDVLLTLLPDFAIIAVGALIAPLLAEESWRAIDRLSFFVLYPALLFSAALSRHINAGDLLLIGGLACTVVTAGFALSLAIARFGPKSPADRAGALQNGWRFNTALGFVAVGSLPAEATGTFAIMVGLGIPLANLYAVTLLARGQAMSPGQQLREVALNPFLLASLGGVMVALSGRSLPSVPLAFVERLADAALPIVLLSLGAALRRARVWPPSQFAFALHGIRLLLLPAATVTIAAIIGAQGTLPATLIVFAALPTASAAHVLAARYGADRNAVAALVMQSSLFGLASLPVWTWVATRLTVG